MVRAFFRDTFRTRPRDQWFDRLFDKDVCIAPVYDLEEIEHDPQVLARQMIVAVPHPTFGAVKQVGISLKMSATPGAVRRAAPRRGQHTAAILEGIGWSRERIAALRESGGTE
jgi:crotonobetainyl-CoA:carnitine CoA-transferase CaiB-like acyl-CoA transferase